MLQVRDTLNATKRQRKAWLTFHPSRQSLRRRKRRSWVKKYANRRLYNTETSSYITLDNLADMVRAGRDFVVYDAKSGDDITRGVLTQIIVEEESKGSSMLPTNFLRQLIGSTATACRAWCRATSSRRCRTSLFSSSRCAR